MHIDLLAPLTDQENEHYKKRLCEASSILALLLGDQDIPTALIAAIFDKIAIPLPQLRELLTIEHREKTGYYNDMEG